jgi:hypothetical protein
MEPFYGRGTSKLGFIDIGSKSDCNENQRFQATFNNSLPGMGNRIPGLSDIITGQAAVRVSLLQFFLPECFVPWNRCFEFRQLCLWATKRVQQVPLVGVLSEQQRYDRLNFDAIRSLRHNNAFRYYVCKCSHEFIWPTLRSLQFLFERNRRD